MTSEAWIPWYVAEGGNGGFTSDPDQAKKDRRGIPMMCPGDMARVWKAHLRAEKARRKEMIDGIWEALYDALDPVDGPPAPGVAEGVARVLALVAYGDDPAKTEVTLIATANEVLKENDE